jgi:hypothetical protein
MEPYKHFALMAGLEEMDGMGRMGRLAHFTEQRDSSIAGLFLTEGADPSFVEEAEGEEGYYCKELDAYLPEQADMDFTLSEEVADSVNQQYQKLVSLAKRDPETAALLLAVQRGEPVKKKDAYDSLRKLMLGGLGVL